jgi:hypothetical protein
MDTIGVSTLAGEYKGYSLRASKPCGAEERAMARTYYSFCSLPALRYYGEIVLVASVATALPMPIEGIVKDKETSCCLLNRSPLFFKKKKVQRKEEREGLKRNL